MHRSVKSDLRHSEFMHLRHVPSECGHSEFMHLRHVPSECGQSGVSLRAKWASVG